MNKKIITVVVIGMGLVAWYFGAELQEYIREGFAPAQ